MAERKQEVYIQNHGGWMNVLASEGLYDAFYAIEGVRSVHVDHQFDDKYNVWVDPRYDGKEVEAEVREVAIDARLAELYAETDVLIRRLEAEIAQQEFDRELAQWEYEIKCAELFDKLPLPWQIHILFQELTKGL